MNETSSEHFKIETSLFYDSRRRYNSSPLYARRLSSHCTRSRRGAGSVSSSLCTTRPGNSDGRFTRSRSARESGLCSFEGRRLGNSFDDRQRLCAVCCCCLIGNVLAADVLTLLGDDWPFLLGYTQPRWPKPKKTSTWKNKRTK